MKKFFLTFVFAIVVIPVFSQATLQHSFSASANYPVFQNPIREYVHEVSPEISYIIPVITENNTLRGFSVYDDHYELTKEIPFALEGNWTTNFSEFKVVIAGKHLFNADDQIEIGLSVRSEYAAVTVFINEDGEILFNEEGLLLDGLYRVGEELRFDFVNWSNNYDLEVYATQGSFSAVDMVVTTHSPYPNPASTTVSIPYSLDGKSTKMHIYDAQGIMMDVRTIYSDAEWIDIDVSTYRPGIYIYEYNGVSNKFVVK